MSQVRKLYAANNLAPSRLQPPTTTGTILGPVHELRLIQICVCSMYLFRLHQSVLHDIGQVSCYTDKDRVTIHYCKLHMAVMLQYLQLFTIKYNKMLLGNLME
jgi:hypothetical protein